MPYAAELIAAREAAELAGREIMALYREFEAIADAPATISTEADRRSQEVILQHLSTRFSNDAFCAEETSSQVADLRRQGPRLWIIDPIDGSRGFARKNDEFSVMIGLVVEGKIVLGVVREPARGRCTFAIQGEGCWSEDGAGGSREACHVSKTSLLTDATLVQSRSEKAKADHGAVRPARLVLTYSAGIKLAQVARGEADIYLSTYNRFNVWDVAAGEILVDEAGGRVTNMHGQTIVYPPDGAARIEGVIATNGALHDAAKDVLK